MKQSLNAIKSPANIFHIVLVNVFLFALKLPKKITKLPYLFS